MSGGHGSARGPDLKPLLRAASAQDSSSRCFPRSAWLARSIFSPAPGVLFTSHVSI
jgi:hypothetical protein